MSDPAILALADGTVFEGVSVGASGERVGEVVFNTAMTGYQEILTDPSYARQLVTLTYPHIGNTGCNDLDDESAQVHAAGLIVRDVPRRPSSWRSQCGLPEWLRRRSVVAIAEIDTRRLTRLLREHGAQAGCISAGPSLDRERALEAARKFAGLAGADLAREVSCARAYDWTEGCLDLDSDQPRTIPADASNTARRVVVMDYGVKRNILRLLVEQGCSVRVVPARTPAAEVLALDPDGIVLANGPGDPAACGYAIEATQAFLAARVPLLGICLGHQLLALAIGARTVKMKFGHHGANHPVIDLDSGRVMISSQNHGFAVEESSLPANAHVTHRSLFDGSNQGIALRDAPAFSLQGHPEAGPGPHDLLPLFDRFSAAMDARRPATRPEGTTA